MAHYSRFPEAVLQREVSWLKRIQCWAKPGEFRGRPMDFETGQFCQSECLVEQSADILEVL
jgi:hypothetical protein